MAEISKQITALQLSLSLPFEDQKLIEELQLVLRHVYGYSWSKLQGDLSGILKKMSGPQIDRLQSALVRRAKGEPIQYISENCYFFKDEFVVRPGVFIPRPDSETILEWCQEKFKNQPPQNIADLGCGSGAIGLSALNLFEQSYLLSVDASYNAIRVAIENAQRLGRLCQMDFHWGFVESIRPQHLPPRAKNGFDLILANPPYIEREDPDLCEDVASYEPALALYSSEKGLWHLKKWVTWALDFLKDGGFMAFEIGYQQGSLAREFLSTLKDRVDQVELLKDYGDRDRVVVVRKKRSRSNG